MQPLIVAPSRLQLRGLQQHLQLAHADESRAKQLLARPYCSPAELAARAAPFELLPIDRQPKGCRDLLLRPPPRRLHWVPRWLNVLLMEPRSASGGSPCGGASPCGTCSCRWWLAAQAGQEDESDGGGDEAINDEEAAASGGPAGRDREAECERRAAARTAHLAEAQARRDARVAAQQCAPQRRHAAWRCLSSCTAWLQEWILRPQLGRTVSHGPPPDGGFVRVMCEDTSIGQFWRGPARYFAIFCDIARYLAILFDILR